VKIVYFLAFVTILVTINSHCKAIMTLTTTRSIGNAKKCEQSLQNIVNVLYILVLY